MMLCYDETKMERVFVASAVNQGNLAQVLRELKAEVSEGETVILEVWKQAPETVVRERIAKRRLDFFNS